MSSVVNKYQGFTKEELAKRITYDPLNGTFFYTKTMDPITTTKGGRLIISIRVGVSVVSFAPSKVALFLTDGIVVKSGQVVKYKDGDNTNYIYSNLSVVDKDYGCKDGYIKPYTTPTQYDRIKLLHPNMIYVVLRGPEQAVYRTPDYDKAVSILAEWMVDKTVHRWDDSMPDHYMPEGGIR